MNKKLIAVAVAGMFVAPAAALAQTSVTITGKVMASWGDFKLSGRAPLAAGKNSENLVRDESSRIIFLMREDLGGGLAAIGKVDYRPSIVDHGVAGPTGESYVGLTSTSMGTLAFGRFDFHYGNHASYTGVHAGLLTNPTAVFDVGGAGTIVYANQTRTNNAVRYGSPKWGDMFEVVLGYSSNPTAASAAPGIACTVTAAVNGSCAATTNNQNENDLRSTVRKGAAWNVNPKVWGKNWEAGYSYWAAKPDLAITTAVNFIVPTAPVAVTPTAVIKQRGDSLYGTYVWGGLRIGLAWNRSKTNSQAIAAGVPGVTTETSRRSVWGVPIAYNWGNHNLYADIYKAGGDKATPFNVAGAPNTGASFFGLTYAYDLSKRTTAALSFSRIKNDPGATYNLFASHSLATAGEDPRFMAVTLQHRF